MGGSSIGGVLVDKWGFPAPFYMVGIALALSLPTLAILNPKRLASEGTEEPGPQQDEPRTDWSYYRLLRHPLFVLNLTSIVIESLIPDFNMSTLEPYLTQFNLTNTEIGMLYTVDDVADCLGSVVTGIISAYKMDKFCIFIGFLLSAVSYLIIGPAPFLPFRPTLAWIYTAQVLRGVGTSAIEVCPYADSLRYIIGAAGYPDTTQTSGFVASISSQFMAITSIAMPPVAGYIAASYGYRDSTMFLFVLLSFWTLVTGYVWLKYECPIFNRDRTSYVPLPQDSPRHCVVTPS
ncbi:uncharacterized protein ISCGN_012082 [Ixodes scapularis]